MPYNVPVTDLSIARSKVTKDPSTAYLKGDMDKNKDMKNKEKPEGASQKGVVKPGKAKYYQPQNSPEKTSKSVYSSVSGKNQANPGVKLAEKRSKKVLRKNALYSDQSIATATRMRGGM